MEYCIYFFIIGAFLGWILECTFKFLTKNFKTTPGILNTPFCILYGLGTLVLSVILNKLTNDFVALFLLSALILSIMEYVTFILLQKIYGIKLWNYSDMKFSINEKVCLEFCLAWGALGAMYIKYLLPILSNFYLKSKGIALSVTIYLLLTIIIVDFIYSSYMLISRKENTTIT